MAGPTQEALLEKRRQDMALLDALIAAQRQRQQEEDRGAIVNYRPTMADLYNAPSNMIRGLLDPMLSADLGISEAARYYLGPTGIPERVSAIAGLLDPGVYEAGYAAADLVDPRISAADRQRAAQDFGSVVALAPAAFMRPAAGAMRTAMSGSALDDALMRARGQISDFLRDESGALPLPPLSNAQRTQITGTFPTYQKALGIFDAVAPEGRTLDYGAGRAMSSRLGFDTYEPFPLEGVNPTYRNAADIPDAAYDRLTNFNVLNVVPRDIRDSIVEDIGRVIRPGGTGLITTRGRDVLNAKGVPGPEPMSIITRPGTDMSTYQKGFTQAELQDYLRYILGDRYGVEPLRLGPAGALIRRNR